MTTIQIELPDSTALAARDAGLLTPQALERLINDALRRKQAADSLLSIAVHCCPLPTAWPPAVSRRCRWKRSTRK